MLLVAVARSSSDHHAISYDARFSHNGANGAESKTTLCLVEFAMWRCAQRHYYSLLSQSASHEFIYSILLGQPILEISRYVIMAAFFIQTGFIQSETRSL